jgi:hypothetical protein
MKLPELIFLQLSLLFDKQDNLPDYHDKTFGDRRSKESSIDHKHGNLDVPTLINICNSYCFDVSTKVAFRA